MMYGYLLVKDRLYDFSDFSGLDQLNFDYLKGPFKDIIGLSARSGFQV